MPPKEKKLIDQVIQGIGTEAGSSTFDVEEELQKDLLKAKYNSYCCLFPHKNFDNLKPSIGKKELEARVEYARRSSQLATSVVDETCVYILDNVSRILEKLLPHLTGIKLDGLTDEIKHDQNLIITLKTLLIENLEYVQIDPKFKIILLFGFAILKTTVQNLMVPEQRVEKTKELSEKYKEI